MFQILAANCLLEYSLYGWILCTLSCQIWCFTRSVLDQITQERLPRPDSSAKYRTWIPPIDFLSVRLAERPRIKLYLEGFKFSTQRPLPAAYYWAMKAAQKEETAASSSHFPFFNIFFSIKLWFMKAWIATIPPLNSSNTMKLPELQNVTGMRQLLSSMGALWRLR